MTELIWDGKYVDGKKTSPIRLALPFQDVETVNESSQSRTLQLDLWSRGEEREWRNRLIWGDKKQYCHRCCRSSPARSTSSTSTRLSLLALTSRSLL